jgi:two-component system, response regulator PdtaR
MGQAQGRSEAAVARAQSVLVIEDETILRMMTAEHLRTKGYRVIEAATADEAVAILLSGEPADIVFSDVQLPGSMSGLSLAIWIRKRFPAMQVILTSGSSAVAERFQAGEFVPFIPKPYDPDEVARRILFILSNPSQPQER